MKPKAIITGMLLAFVALSIGYLIVKETKTSRQGEKNSDGLVALSSEQPPMKGAPDIATELTEKVVAYYFYGNVRCQTCRKIEAYTSESILATFTNELSARTLEWKTANVDEKENEHFVKDYELTSRAVVLVKIVDGKQAEWKSLARIWDLVGDKDLFQKYIKDETKAFLMKGKQ